MNGLVNLLTWMEKEARMLLTSHKKATSAVSVESENISVTFNLKKYTFYVGSDKAAVISVSGNENNSLTTLTFSGMTSQEQRTLVVERIVPEANEDLMAKYRVFVAYGNNDDRDKIDAGQSVSLSYNLTITATAAITNIAVTYEDVEE